MRMYNEQCPKKCGRLCSFTWAVPDKPVTACLPPAEMILTKGTEPLRQVRQSPFSPLQTYSICSRDAGFQTPQAQKCPKRPKQPPFRRCRQAPEAQKRPKSRTWPRPSALGFGHHKLLYNQAKFTNDTHGETHERKNTDATLH